MGKLVKLVLVLGVVAVIGYFATTMMSGDESADGATANKDGVRVEEKYGFTSGGVEGS